MITEGEEAQYTFSACSRTNKVLQSHIRLQGEEIQEILQTNKEENIL